MPTSQRPGQTRQSYVYQLLQFSSPAPGRPTMLHISWVGRVALFLVNLNLNEDTLAVLGSVGIFAIVGL